MLDEAACIGATLRSLQSWRVRGHDVIVVDGGSSDRSRAIATPLCDSLLVARAGRALQMNTGAAVASGDLLLFLHADTALASDAEEVLANIRHPQWGRFDLRFDHAVLSMRIIAACMNWRSRLTHIATGDQAIFVSRSLFRRVGGFPAIPLMEDIALSKRLRMMAPPLCLRAKVTSSARRWRSNGTVKTIFLMWFMRCAYALGVSPQRLARCYDNGSIVWRHRAP